MQADSITIAPRVAGYIAEVLVTDNQPVKSGQVLARIDDRDLRTALDQAIADRAAAESRIANIAAQLDLQQSVIGEAKAQLASAEAAATFAAQDQKRYSELAHTGAGSVQQAQQTQSLLLQRAADLQRAHAALTNARAAGRGAADGRGRGAGGAAARRRGRAAGAAEPELRDDRRAGRRHRRARGRSASASTSRPAPS